MIYNNINNITALSIVQGQKCKYKNDSITTISSYAFACYSNLLEVSFPNAVTIANCAFRSCYLLSRAYLPSVRSVDYSAFMYCSSLAEINLSNVSYIGYDAFRSCTSLSTASIPNCEFISQAAFSNCKNLTSLYVDGDDLVGIPIMRFGESVFASTPIYSNSISGQYGTIYAPSALIPVFKYVLSGLKASYVSISTSASYASVASFVKMWDWNTNTSYSPSLWSNYYILPGDESYTALTYRIITNSSFKFLLRGYTIVGGNGPAVYLSIGSPTAFSDLGSCICSFNTNYYDVVSSIVTVSSGNSGKYLTCIVDVEDWDYEEYSELYLSGNVASSAGIRYIIGRL